MLTAIGAVVPEARSPGASCVAPPHRPPLRRKSPEDEDDQVSNSQKARASPPPIHLSWLPNIDG